MSRFFVALNSSVPQARIYNASGGTLSLESSLDLDTASVNAQVAQVGHSGEFAIWAHETLTSDSSELSLLKIKDGLEKVAKGDFSSGSADASLSSDDSVVFATRYNVKANVYKRDGSSLTLESQFGDDGIRRKAIAQSPTESRAVYSDDDQLFLVEISEDAKTLTQIATLDGTINPLQGGLRYSPDGKFVAAANSGNLRVFSVQGDAISQVASASDFLDGVNPHWSSDGSSIYVSDAKYSFDGSSLSRTNTYVGRWWTTANADGSLILSADKAASGAKIYLIDGASFKTLDSVTVDTDKVEGMGAVGVSGPTTNEELFQASYADASAADPKVTALTRPADVQRSIDTDVSNLKDGPNLYTVEAIFDIGELENLNPYNSTTEKPRVFFVKDDQPGLRQGKNLLLKSYTIRDADPAVPVTCTFWG